MGKPKVADTPYALHIAEAERALQTWLGALPTPTSSGDEATAELADEEFRAHLAEARRLRKN